VNCRVGCQQLMDFRHSSSACRSPSALAESCHRSISVRGRPACGVTIRAAERREFERSHRAGCGAPESGHSESPLTACRDGSGRTVLRFMHRARRRSRRIC
jgi:hypothetical protein